MRWARIRVAPDKTIGYIRADRFDDGAAELADQAMDELSRTHGLVIDIRANTGGNISALRLASYFIEGSPAFALLSRPYLQALGHPVTPADIAAAPKVVGAAIAARTSARRCRRAAARRYSKSRIWARSAIALRSSC